MQVFGSNFVLELLSVLAIRQQNREERGQNTWTARKKKSIRFTESGLFIML